MHLNALPGGKILPAEKKKFYQKEEPNNHLFRAFCYGPYCALILIQKKKKSYVEALTPGISEYDSIGSSLWGI